MTCACGKPAKLSGRVAMCAVCYRAKRYVREIDARIELSYRRARRMLQYERTKHGRAA